MALDYNVSAKLKKLKKLVESQFLVGHSIKVVVNLTGLSEHIIQEWHDEFVLSTLKESSSRRIFTRELLLKNAPQMILILSQLAKQKGDEKLAYSAASAVLGFGAKFLAEDARIQGLENKLRNENDNDAGLRRTLFDFVSPDNQGGSMTKASAKPKVNEEDEAELERAFERLMEKEMASEEAIPAEEETRAKPDEPDNDEVSAYYRSPPPPSQKPAVDLFEGIDYAD